MKEKLRDESGRKRLPFYKLNKTTTLQSLFLGNKETCSQHQTPHDA
jgi:hypothetical protein